MFTYFLARRFYSAVLATHPWLADHALQCMLASWYTQDARSRVKNRPGNLIAAPFVLWALAHLAAAAMGIEVRYPGALSENLISTWWATVGALAAAATVIAFVAGMVVQRRRERRADAATRHDRIVAECSRYVVLTNKMTKLPLVLSIRLARRRAERLIRSRLFARITRLFGALRAALARLVALLLHGVSRPSFRGLPNVQMIGASISRTPAPTRGPNTGLVPVRPEGLGCVRTVLGTSL